MPITGPFDSPSNTAAKSESGPQIVGSTPPPQQRPEVGTRVGPEGRQWVLVSRHPGAASGRDLDVWEPAYGQDYNPYQPGIIYTKGGAIQLRPRIGAESPSVNIEQLYPTVENLPNPPAFVTPEQKAINTARPGGTTFDLTTGNPMRPQQTQHITTPIKPNIVTKEQAFKNISAAPSGTYVGYSEPTQLIVNVGGREIPIGISSGVAAKLAKESPQGLEIALTPGFLTSLEPQKQDKMINAPGIISMVAPDTSGTVPIYVSNQTLSMAPNIPNTNITTPAISRNPIDNSFFGKYKNPALRLEHRLYLIPEQVSAIPIIGQGYTLGGRMQEQGGLRWLIGTIISAPGASIAGIGATIIGARMLIERPESRPSFVEMVAEIPGAVLKTPKALFTDPEMQKVALEAGIQSIVLMGAAGAYSRATTPKVVSISSKIIPISEESGLTRDFAGIRRISPKTAPKTTAPEPSFFIAGVKTVIGPEGTSALSEMKAVTIVKSQSIADRLFGKTTTQKYTSNIGVAGIKSREVFIVDTAEGAKVLSIKEFAPGGEIIKSIENSQILAEGAGKLTVVEQWDKVGAGATKGTNIITSMSERTIDITPQPKQGNPVMTLSQSSGIAYGVKTLNTLNIERISGLKPVKVNTTEAAKMFSRGGGKLYFESGYAMKKYWNEPKSTLGFYTRIQKESEVFEDVIIIKKGLPKTAIGNLIGNIMETGRFKFSRDYVEGIITEKNIIKHELGHAIKNIGTEFADSGKPNPAAFEMYNYMKQGFVTTKLAKNQAIVFSMSKTGKPVSVSQYTAKAVTASQEIDRGSIVFQRPLSKKLGMAESVSKSSSLGLVNVRNIEKPIGGYVSRGLVYKIGKQKPSPSFSSPSEEPSNGILDFISMRRLMNMPSADFGRAYGAPGKSTSILAAKHIEALMSRVEEPPTNTQTGLMIMQQQLKIKERMIQRPENVYPQEFYTSKLISANTQLQYPMNIQRINKITVTTGINIPKDITAQIQVQQERTIPRQTLRAGFRMPSVFTPTITTPTDTGFGVLKIPMPSQSGIFRQPAAKKGRRGYYEKEYKIPTPKEIRRMI